MMKKIIAAVATVVAVLLLVSSSAYAENIGSYSAGVYYVTAEGGVKLYSQPSESLDYKINARKDVYLTVIKTDGSFGYTVYDSVYGWIDLSFGVEFVSSMPTVTGQEKPEGTKGIKITRLPDKLTYIQGEDSADITGLEVAIVFNDEQSSMLNVEGYTVSFPDLYTLGEKNVTVYYGGYSTSFKITVERVPVTAIVLTLPEKTSFIEGKPVSFDGLEVTAYFSDGRDGGKGIVLNRDEYTVSGITEGDSTLAAGTYKVTVSYLYPEITASFHIYITGKSVTSLKLLKLPPNLTLYQGQSFDNSDFLLEATYDNGVTEEISEFNIEYDSMQTGTFTARIYYMDKYVAFDYTVRELVQTGIELGDTTLVGSYAGSDLNFGSLTVYAVFNSGEKRLIQSGYTLKYDINPSQVGKYKVTVSYGEFTADFEYTVADRPQRILGDVSGDGLVNASDARLALRAAAELDTLDTSSFYAADVDFDDNITAADARKILRYSAGLEDF